MQRVAFASAVLGSVLLSGSHHHSESLKSWEPTASREAAPNHETLWQVEITPAANQPDHAAHDIRIAALDLQIPGELRIRTAYGYLLQGTIDEDQARAIARRLLVDSVAQVAQVDPLGSPSANVVEPDEVCFYVMLKSGVTDPVAQTTAYTIAQADFPATVVRTYRKYWLTGVSESHRERLKRRVLANASIEEIVPAPLQLNSLRSGNTYDFQLQTISMLAATDEQLVTISRVGGLSLTLVEMQTIQQHFRSLEREPTDIELETVAQTWSEHCSHKTLAGRIEYTDEHGTRHFGNMLKETIFAATNQLRQQWGDRDWCVSVFKDNAGIVKFDDQFHICFKVETHNRPSAIEPYGGANTGIGGVIRDTLGTGLGAKPICNTDVFCFARPDTDNDSIPEGILHPARVMRGVVAGVRDYGNRMGIPTVNGAVYFDDRYLGNPLVFCGNVGLIPCDKSFKRPHPGDWIVTLGGRTGRDGIHGATFSSAELTDKSEKLSGGAVQIGNAITEKMTMDVLLAARDRGLFSAVTDCGAGGFSSAVGEMAEETGAVVDLDLAPLKYEGLSYTEIWISEAQERMVLSVPPDKWEQLKALCDSESVEATVIGKFTNDHQLTLRFRGQVVGEMPMSFLHDGRPPIVRQATYRPAAISPLRKATPSGGEPERKTEIAKLDACDAETIQSTLLQLMGQLNIASKHWIIRQYDHEVQGGSVIKPLVGAAGDGPSDAAVVRPRLDSQRAIVVSCGMAPTFGDFDTYHMAASGLDEALRNCVATGADPRRIAVLDNFSWGYTDRPETLGALVRAALACHDLALAWGVPFISGKDSLNNEFSFVNAAGQRQTISIPHTLLISALGQVESAEKCVTMDLKRPGNRLFQIGGTANEMGGSHFSQVRGATGGQVPKVHTQRAMQIFLAVHQAITAGYVTACHDLCEGGLAVALSEMALAARLGVDIDVAAIEVESQDAADDFPDVLCKLFSESNSRFVVEVPVDSVPAFRSLFAGLPLFELGQTTDSGRVIIQENDRTLVDADIETLRHLWQSPLNW